MALCLPTKAKQLPLQSRLRQLLYSTLILQGSRFTRWMLRYERGPDVGSSSFSVDGGHLCKTMLDNSWEDL